MVDTKDVQPPSVPEPSGDAREREEWIFTNVSNGEVLVQDLGYRSPSGMFSPETFKVNETKDLAKKYSRRELRQSKSLIIATDDMKVLVRGAKQMTAPSQDPQEPLKRAALANKDSEAAFQDPTKNVFDDKYDELLKKEQREDERTQSSRR